MPGPGERPIRKPVPISKADMLSGSTRPLMIAHRCGANMAPENTCSAVVQSSFYRPDFFEVDIRHSLDGTPYVIHDEDVKRTTNFTEFAASLNLPSARVSELSDEVIDSLDAGTWISAAYKYEPVPTLERILGCANPAPLALEIKEPDITQAECSAIISLLNSKGDISSVIMSFHREALETWRKAEATGNPQAVSPRRMVLLATEFSPDFTESPYDVLGLLQSAVTGEIVTLLHASGKSVWVWTVNESFEQYILMGVDGIVTDSPDRLRKVLPPS